LVIGMRVAENDGGYIFAIFILAYGTEQLGLGSSTMLAAVAAAAAASFFVTPLWGALSDRIGRRPVYMIAPIFLILAAFPFFWLVDTGVAVLIGVALVVVRVFGIDPMFAIQPAFFSELFGTRVRYSGVSLRLSDLRRAGGRAVTGDRHGVGGGHGWHVGRRAVRRGDGDDNARVGLLRHRDVSRGALRGRGTGSGGGGAGGGATAAGLMAAGSEAR
jgi:MFS family permease